jgi:glycosyltransferase involved in cell wall biosynthesis
VGDKMKLAIVIPAFNEGKMIAQVIESLPKILPEIDQVISIVVDDGSNDDTYLIASGRADYVVRCMINMGVGLATRMGIEAAKKLDADIVLTMDADGQHCGADINHLIAPIVAKKADITLGTRMLNTKGMPFVKVFGNWTMNVLTFLLFHIWVTDSQSGMKAFSREAVGKMNINSVSYEVCSEIVGEARHHRLKIQEVPIKTIYTEYSRQKGQNIFNAVNIFTKLVSLRIGKRR